MVGVRKYRLCRCGALRRGGRILEMVRWFLSGNGGLRYRGRNGGIEILLGHFLLVCTEEGETLRILVGVCLDILY